MGSRRTTSSEDGNRSEAAWTGQDCYRINGHGSSDAFVVGYAALERVSRTLIDFANVSKLTENLD